MLNISQAKQLTIFSSLIALVSLASILYIVIASPAYLRQSSEGVPFFTPPVLHPDTGAEITIDELVKHYKTGGS